MTLEHARKLGGPLVLVLAEREFGKPLNSTQHLAILLAVQYGQARMSPVDLIPLSQSGLLWITQGPWITSTSTTLTMFQLGERLMNACRDELEKVGAHAAFSRKLVIDYLAALDARRAVMIKRPTSKNGRTLRGMALSRVVKAAQDHLEAAETALRKAVL